MAEFPALPLWTDAYLADTRHLTTVEHGAYLLLLMEAWRRPSCSLPDDEVLLARLSGLSIEEWDGVRGAVMAFWVLDKRRKEWRQSRLLKEREYVSKKSTSQRHRILKRWNKTEKTHTGAIPEAIPERYPDDTPTPTPTPNQKDLLPVDTKRGSEVAAKASKSDPFREALAPHMSEEILADFCKHRRNKKAASTVTAARAFFKNAKDSGLTLDQAAVVAIDRNWITVKPEWIGNSTNGGGGRKTETAFDAYEKIAKLKGWTDEPSGISGDRQDAELFPETKQLGHSRDIVDL